MELLNFIDFFRDEFKQEIPNESNKESTTKPKHLSEIKVERYNEIFELQEEIKKLHEQM